MSSTRDVTRALAGPRETLVSALVAIDEDQWFERKSIRIQPSALAKTLVGMANADGGVIVIGLSDGHAEGTAAMTSHVNELMQAHVQYCEPAVPARASLVSYVAADGVEDALLMFDVRAGDTVYGTTRDEVYLRIGDETRKLTHRQREELLFDRGRGSYEATELVGSSAADLDAELLAEYARAVGATDAQRLAIARGLATTDGALTVAGLLLFGSEPQARLPEAFVRILKYRDVERGTGSRQQITADDRIDGPIPWVLVQAQARVRELQPTRRALAASGRFEPVPLVPEEAWLEGIVNAVVHRSYSLAGDHIRVEVFPDRIEISSPGRFPGIFDHRNPLDSPRYARNPRIARVCADQHFGQELGEGIRRMFDEMRAAGLIDPLYQQTQGSVRLTLSADPADRALEQRLPKDARAILAALREAGQLSTSEVAEVIGVSRITAKKRLDALLDEGLVAWEGKSPRDPRASWRLPLG